MLISSDPDVRSVVSQTLRKYPWLKWERGGCHGRLRSERSLDFVPIPFSPSDFRATRNLRAQLRRLGERGEGLIAAKRSRFARTAA
jgi:hypothetical protein